MSLYDQQTLWQAFWSALGYALAYLLAFVLGIVVISRFMTALTRNYLSPVDQPSESASALPHPVDSKPVGETTKSEKAEAPQGSRGPQGNKSKRGSMRLDKRYQTLGTIIGSIEGAMYTTSVLLGHPEFIGVWLVLRAVGEWRQVDYKEPHANAFVGTSGEYTIFLIGNALNVSLGVITALLIEHFVPSFPSFAKWTW